MRLYPKDLPDDPYLNMQWSLEQIGAILAWGMTVTGAEGSSAVTIAVVDGGILSSHPDLGGKLVAGYNAIDDSANAEPDAGEDHGTLVASIAAANSGNGKGIAGTAQLAKLMPVKIGMDEFSIIKGALGAVARGARVINMSLGSCFQECATCQMDCEPPSEAGAEAALTAYGDGAVLVASAGNESTTMTSYPAGYPYVLGVSATGPSGTLAFYSNMGPQVDVAAPGGGGSHDCHNSVDVIGATDPTHACPGWLFQDLRTAAGTSMSAPHVAGLAAVLFGQDLSRTNDDVVSLIRSSAYQPEGATGWNDSYGYGRIDMYKALTMSVPVSLARLSVSVTIVPVTPEVGTVLAIVLTAANNGSGDAVGVVPDVTFASGESLLGELSRPSPADIRAGTTASFTWTYSATGAGTPGFTVLARGTDRATGVVVKATATMTFHIISPSPVPSSLASLESLYTRVALGRALVAPNVLDLSVSLSHVVVVIKGTRANGVADLSIFDAMGGLVKKSPVVLDARGQGVAYITVGTNLAPGVYWALISGGGAEDRKPFKVVTGRRAR
jgi:subtilisin family serine protease